MIATSSSSLRNFKLHINQMKQLNLHITDFATQITDALAVMHWKAKLDAYDIGFVVGSAPNVSINTDALSFEAVKKMPRGIITISSRTGFDFEHRMIHLWLIDFSQCNEMPSNKLGVAMVVKGCEKEYRGKDHSAGRQGPECGEATAKLSSNSFVGEEIIAFYCKSQNHI